MDPFRALLIATILGVVLGVIFNLERGGHFDKIPWYKLLEKMPWKCLAGWILGLITAVIMFGVMKK